MSFQKNLGESKLLRKEEKESIYHGKGVKGEKAHTLEGKLGGGGYLTLLWRKCGSHRRRMLRDSSFPREGPEQKPAAILAASVSSAPRADCEDTGYSDLRW